MKWGKVKARPYFDLAGYWYAWRGISIYRRQGKYYMQKRLTSTSEDDREIPFETIKYKARLWENGNKDR